MVNMTSSAMNMSRTGLKSTTATGTDSSGVTQKDSSQGTDGSFLSILASISGIAPPVAQSALRLENAPLKSAKSTAIGQIGQAKARLVSSLTSMGAKSGRNDESSGILQDGHGTAGKQKPGLASSAIRGTKNSLAGYAVDSPALAKMGTSRTDNAMVPVSVLANLQNHVQADVQVSLGKMPVELGLQQVRQTPQFAYSMSQSGTKVLGQGAATEHSISATGLQQTFSKQISGILTGHEAGTAMPGSQNVSDRVGKSRSGKNSGTTDFSKINLIHPAGAEVSGVSVHNGHQALNQANTLDVSQPNWMSDFGKIVGQVSNDHGGTIQVKVHPEGMGDLLISVSNTATGLSIQVEANQFSTAQWLGQQTGQLQNAVSQLGISVSNVQVGFGQANLGQPGSGHSNRKSNDGEKRIQSMTSTSDGRAKIQEPVSANHGGALYSHNSSISFQA